MLSVCQGHVSGPVMAGQFSLDLEAWKDSEEGSVTGRSLGPRWPCLPAALHGEPGFLAAALGVPVGSQKSISYAVKDILCKPSLEAGRGKQNKTSLSAQRPKGPPDIPWEQP